LNSTAEVTPNRKR